MADPSPGPSNPRGRKGRRSELAAQIDPSAMLGGQQANYPRFTRAQQKEVFDHQQAVIDNESEIDRGGNDSTNEAAAIKGKARLMEESDDSDISDLSSVPESEFSNFELLMGDENTIANANTSDHADDDVDMFDNDSPAYLSAGADADDPFDSPQQPRTDPNSVADIVRATIQEEMSKLQASLSDPAYLGSLLEAQGYLVIPPNASQGQTTNAGAQYDPAEVQPVTFEHQHNPTGPDPTPTGAQHNPAEVQQQVDQANTGQGIEAPGTEAIDEVPPQFDTPCVGCTRRMAQVDANDRERLMSVDLCLFQTCRRARKCDVCRPKGRKCVFIPVAHQAIRTNAALVSATFRRVKYEGYIMDANDRAVALNVLNDLHVAGL